MEDTNFKLYNKRRTSRWIQDSILSEKCSLEHINFIFCSDTYLNKKNVEYLQHDTFTDVITFNYSEVANMLEGEIYISVDRVLENSQFYNIPFYYELYTVMIHGVLHLIGYNDKNDKDQLLMKKKEKQYLNKLEEFNIELNTGIKEFRSLCKNNR